MFVLGCIITSDNNINNVLLTKLMVPRGQICREHYVTNNNAKSAYTTHILKTGHDNGPFKNTKKLEKLVKKVGRGIFGGHTHTHIYIYICIKWDRLLEEQMIGEYNQII